MEFVINIIFHILNFAVVIGLGVYLFRSKIMNLMRQEMIVEVLERSSLFKRLEGLKKQSKNLVMAYDHQRSFHQDLEKKMERWQQVVQAQQDNRITEGERIAQKMHERSEHEMEERHRRTLSRIVLAQALAQADEQLVRCFMQEQVKKAYTTKVIDQLRKEAI